MLKPDRYRINTPKVIHQTIEGEVVVINLDSGSYYSLTESAQRIWTALESVATADEITTILQREYSGVNGDLPAIVTIFLNELIAENLIVPSNETRPTDFSNSPHDTPAKTFTPPALKKFTDMQELLLLDPVHEVDVTGWPQAKPENSPGTHAS